MLGYGKIKKKFVYTDVKTGKQHGWLYSQYSNGLKRFAKARRF